MNAAIGTSLLKLAAGLGLAFVLGHAVVARSRAAALPPLTAIYRTNATPLGDTEASSWQFTRPESRA